MFCRGHTFTIKGGDYMNYERTHPWIKYSLDLNRAQPNVFWFKLGEIKSKCVHIAQAPLLPSVAKYIHRVYLAKGVIGTTAIEGNTLTMDDALQVIDGKDLALPQSKDYLRLEITNVIDASNDLLNSVVINQKSLDISVKQIKHFNAQILKDIELDKDVFPGEIRTHKVVVGNYRPPEAEDCEYLLNKLCDWLKNPDFSLGKGEEIATGVLRAIVAHLYIAWIHPFGDGNGRTARLLELAILLSAGVPSAAAHLLSNYYNETRELYYRALEKASRDKEKGVFYFIEYALVGLTEQLVSQLEDIQKQQMQIVWINFIHKSFSGKKSVVFDRQKLLILDLAELREYKPITKGDIRVVSKRIEQLYREKTDKTIARDLNALKERKLLTEIEKGTYVMNMKEHLLTMIPPSIQDIPFPL